MHRAILQPAFLLTLVGTLVHASADAQDMRGRMLDASRGFVSGIVQDVDGIPQMGALVEAILPNSRIVAAVTTDARGRYRLSLDPGSYRVRATAALLSPAVRESLQIGTGAKAVVNLTLSAILAPTGWLPVSRRTLSEPGDDWMWTLRSSPSRSILRLASKSGDASQAESGEAASMSSSSNQESRKGASAGRVALKDSDGGFARGGSHTILVLSDSGKDGASTVLSSDFSGPRSPYPVAPSADVSIGVQRHTLLAGLSRAVLTYSNHPELVSSRGATGLQSITIRSGQRIELGDLIRVDAGSVLRSSSLGGNAAAIEPFLQVSAHAGADTVLAYTMTRSRDVASLEDLDRVQAAVPVAMLRSGSYRLETGSHHALSVTGKVGRGVAEVAVYHDTLHNPQVSGAGVLSSLELRGEGIVADPTTHSYRVAAPDYRSSGFRASLRHPLTETLQVNAEFVTGDTIRISHEKVEAFQDVYRLLRASSAYAASVSMDGRVVRSGTRVRAAYRWQPHHSLTALDAFHAGDAGAFLSCSVHQALGGLRILPKGMEAVVDVQNLLAQGYEPLVTNDGQTLFLAQTPRAVQAGVSFTF